MDSRIFQNSYSKVEIAAKSGITRRRSNSVSDIKTLFSKPQSKGPQKGALNLKRSEDIKPKVPKRKIPDWDYKSRFYELQKKHDFLQEQLKETKSKITDIDNILKERDRLLLENENYVKQVNYLNNRFAAITRENALVEVLKKEIECQEHLRRTLHNTIQDLKGNIRVFCRVRPPINDIESRKPLAAMSFLNKNTMEIQTKCREVVGTLNNWSGVKMEFTFDKVFPPEADQCEVFEELSELVQSALDGFHVCVFAYGQTGSGKTYTMQGSSDNDGMIPRTIDFIFERIEKLQHFGWKYTVTSSFIDIYNENVKDLLNPDRNQNHELTYSEGHLLIAPIASAAELKSLMKEALQNRAVAATDFNEHSSRTHAITNIYLKGFNSASRVTYMGSINLVDLAGSETNTKERLTETANINKSLFTLGNVMLALHNKDCHIPYSNSKLTHFLQSCLRGNSKSLMFVNISPFEECLEESLNSLKFAAKVKDIKISVKRNKTHAT